MFPKVAVKEKKIFKEARAMKDLKTYADLF